MGAAVAVATAAEPEAEDAFGVRIGNERIGLYGEEQVRGFALEDAGNYRIDGLYFVRAAAPSNAVIAGTATRLGVNALRYDFPAASGIVDYRLRALTPGRSGQVETGWRAHAGPFLDAYFALADAKARRGAAGGVILAPSQCYSDGAEGEYASVGLVPQWRADGTLRVRGVINLARWRYQADAGYLPAAGQALPRIERGRYNGQDWSRFATRDANLGLIVDGAELAGWGIEGAAFVSRAERERSDFNLFSQVAPDGSAQATTFLVGPQRTHATSAELRASRSFGGDRRRQRVVAALRLRDSRARTDTGSALALGAVNLFDDVPQAPAPELPPSAQSRDDVTQATLGAHYRIEFGTRAAFGLGAQRSRYDKTVAAAGEAETRRVENTWLYDASAVLALGPRVTAFATATRSLEEAGVAPQNAVNRNAILPPVLATQRELGFKWQLREALALIVNGFDLRKPTPGVDADGVYRFVGDARHRGVELSLAGNLGDGIDLSLGALWMRPEVRGALVDAGVVGDEAVGRSARIAVANVAYTPTRLPAWTFDAQATYSGPRQADAANTFRTPGYTVVDLGLRHRFALAGREASLRLRLLNASDAYAWFATPSQLQFYNRERALEARLEVPW